MKSHYHCVYKLKYHLVLVTKYRRKCLNRVMLERLERICQSLCEKWDVGLDEFVGENASNLSGGEKQRLALARAFYRDCDLLIFDEVTNKLDNDTSDEILKLIYSLRKNKILIMVSHDLNTLKNCDYILELKDSKIKVNK